MWIKKTKRNGRDVWHKSSWLEYIAYKYGFIAVGIEFLAIVAILYLILRG